MLVITKKDARKRPDVDWGIIEALYSSGAMTPAQIAARLGLKPITISSRASREKWLRPPRKAKRGENKSVDEALDAEDKRRRTRGRKKGTSDDTSLASDGTTDGTSSTLEGTSDGTSSAPEGTSLPLKRGRKGKNSAKGGTLPAEVAKAGGDRKGNQSVTNSQVDPRKRSIAVLADHVEELKDEYVQNMSETVAEVGRHIRKMAPEAVLSKSKQVKDIDDVARKTFGLDKKDESGDRNLIINLGVLRGTDPEIVVDGNVVDS